MKYHLGIDPGWKNLGIALTVEDDSGKFSLVKSEVMNPSSHTNEAQCAQDIYEKYIRYSGVSTITIERFVPFGGQSTHEAEFINILIGAISGIIHSEERNKDVTSVHYRIPVVPLRVRSVEWKVALVKALVKSKGFDNPSTSLDKKFSMAAAAACLSLEKLEKGVTDHEADAIALACYQSIINAPKLGK